MKICGKLILILIKISDNNSLVMDDAKVFTLILKLAHKY